MLRYSGARLRVSTFSIFLHDLSKLGKLKGRSNPQRFASGLYKKLSASEMRDLQRRAERKTYPALDAFNQFQRTYASRFTHLTNKQRQRKVAQLWATFKKQGKLVNVPGTALAKARNKATSARSILKKASKQTTPAKSLA